jgi:hypothetical protein
MRVKRKYNLIQRKHGSFYELTAAQDNRGINLENKMKTVKELKKMQGKGVIYTVENRANGEVFECFKPQIDSMINRMANVLILSHRNFSPLGLGYPQIETNKQIVN